MSNDFYVKFETAQSMDVQFIQEGFSCDFGPGVPSGDYTGEYEVTPSTETQVLATRNKTLEGDITIHPIPNNYGLITWNGSTLTVS